MGTLPHPEPLSGESYSAVELSLDGSEVVMLDQRRLPAEEVYERLHTAAEVAEAIRSMVVRGAPAIGISAAYALVLAARPGASHADLERAATELKQTRPTAVNLAWAVDTLLATVRDVRASELRAALASGARKIHREDVAACRRMGQLGAESVPDGATILTYCNAGALATGGYGSALGVVRAAHAAGKRIRVLASETRPYLQGARLTAWELMRSGIDVRLICDNNAGHLYSRGEITLAVVGADRIAANGDVANKIGTYTVACLSKLHERPFYVAAPWSTVDLSCPRGAEIPIEQRAPEEVTELRLGQAFAASERGAAAIRLAPAGVGALNPAFDVTPGGFVSALFTERGVVSPMSAENLRALNTEAARA